MCIPHLAVLNHLLIMTISSSQAFAGCMDILRKMDRAAVEGAIEGLNYRKNVKFSSHRKL